MKRILIFLLTVFIFISGIFIYSFGVIEWSLLNFRKEFSRAEAPFLYIIPVNKKNESIPLKQWQAFSFHEVSFKTPWLEGVKEEKGKNGLEIIFPYARVLILDYSQTKNLYENLNKTNPMEIEWLKTDYGEEYLKSNYNFYKLIYQSRPTDISLFTPKKEAQAKFLLITAKSMFMPVDTVREFSMFTVSNIKGFQYKDCGRFDGLIEFEKDGKHYAIIIKKKGLTSEELDFITASLKN